MNVSITRCYKMTKPHLSIKERFLLHVNIPENLNDCWEWVGCKFPNNYGCFDKHSLAHRVSFELFVGEIPEGMCVCHSCDNRKCVNPTHLFLGTVQDNANDRNNKDRQAKGESCNHKLTRESVYQIREKIEQGYTQQEIADIFGVCNQNISKIKSNKSWKWLK